MFLAGVSIGSFESVIETSAENNDAGLPWSNGSARALRWMNSEPNRGTAYDRDRERRRT
jgi:hypothetical protein